MKSFHLFLCAFVADQLDEHFLHKTQKNFPYNMLEF